MSPPSLTEIVNNSLHIHIHQKNREGITLLDSVVTCGHCDLVSSVLRYHVHVPVVWVSVVASHSSGILFLYSRKHPPEV